MIPSISIHSHDILHPPDRMLTVAWKPRKEKTVLDKQDKEEKKSVLIIFTDLTEPSTEKINGRISVLFISWVTRKKNFLKFYLDIYCIIYLFEYLSVKYIYNL